MNPRVTVIIPTYNRAGDTLRAIASALGQTLPPHEVIVVDDGSTDDTAARVGTLPPPVKYLHQANGGVARARNNALRHVTGDHVALLDSDDYWEPAWLETATRLIASVPGASVGVCIRTRAVTPDGRELGVDIASKTRNYDGHVIRLQDLMLGGMMGSNVVMRTETMRAIGDFDPTLKTGEDIDFALRVATVATVVAIDQTLVNVTSTPGSLSKNINTGNRLKVYDKFEQTHPEAARQHAEAFRDARVRTTLAYARDLMWARQLPAAWQRLRESWRYRPTWGAVVVGGKLALLFILGRNKPAR